MRFSGPSVLALVLLTSLLPFPSTLLAQSTSTPIAASAPTVVPALIPYSGMVREFSGQAGDLGVTFLIFKDEQGGEPLWAETQTVAVDASGRFKVHLGGSMLSGLPGDLFSTGEARWLEIQVAGQNPQPRVLLASVPYALKAADAATLGGLPASAFVLVGTGSRTAAVSPAIMPDVVSTVTTTGGTTNNLAKFSGPSTIVDSILFDNGTEVGIGTTTPTTTLDVKGTALVSGAFTANGGATIGGSLVLPALGTATASGGFNSQLIKIETSAYDSSTQAVVNPRFEWQAVENGNNTSAPSATLNLLSSTTTAGATQTGFSFNPNGTINFAPGQTFPSTGSGTITGVIPGTALTGGGTTGNVTLNLDLTKVPELATGNTFTATQTITGGDLNLPATTSSTVGVINIGGKPFLHGFSQNEGNVFVGGAGNFTTNGFDTTATGFGALAKQTSGANNTAVGFDALSNMTDGDFNTAIGKLAGTANGTLTNTTAVGADATAGQNNTLVLGNTNSTPGQEFVNVGIGTETPVSSLEIAVSAPGAIGPALTLTNSGGDIVTNFTNYTYGAAAIDFNTQAISTSGTYNPGARIEAVDDGRSGDSIWFLSNEVFDGPGANQGLQLNMNIGSNGRVGIGGGDPDASDFFSQLVVTSVSLPVNDEYSAIAAIGGTNNEGNGTAGIESFGGSVNGESGTGSGGIGGYFVGGDGEGVNGIGGDGIDAYSGSVADGHINGFAGDFIGNVTIAGTLFADEKDFRIDHPLDPANKYLVHASVKSSEMMNIYSGNVTTDELGIATITLPDWFESLNSDFRYQLTTIGRDAHAWISQKVADKQFKISTNASHVEVSWQITAVRQDAYAKAHPLVVEEEKPTPGTRLLSASRTVWAAKKKADRMGPSSADDATNEGPGCRSQSSRAALKGTRREPAPRPVGKRGRSQVRLTHHRQASASRRGPNVGADAQPANRFGSLTADSQAKPLPSARATTRADGFLTTAFRSIQSSADGAGMTRE